MSDNQDPCPFVYANGKKCCGFVDRWHVYGHRKGDSLSYARKVRLWCDEKGDHAGSISSSSTIAAITTAHAAVTALHAMLAESLGWSAENDRVRAVVESAYRLPAVTAAEKAAMAALVLDYESAAIEPAIGRALRSIAA